MFRPLLDDETRDAAAFRTALREILAAWRSEEALWETRGSLPTEVFTTLGDAGLFATRWRDGLGGGLRFAIALAEETAGISMGCALGISLHAEVFCAVLEANKRRPRLAGIFADALAGRAIGCVGSTEPRGGSDIAAVETVATKCSGGWSIDGTKWFTSNSSIATHAVVLARAGDGMGERGGRREGPTLFVVPLDHPGARRLPPAATLGVRSCDTGGLQLNVENLPDDLRASPPGLGLLTLSRALQLERFVASCQVLSIARQATGLASAHLRHREQFGERLSSRQALRHRLADLKSRILSVESLAARLAAAMEKGQAIGHETAALKLLAAQVAQDAVDESLQMMGGRGYLAHFPFERWWRDVRLARIGGGADEVMRELIASELDAEDPTIDAQWKALYDGDPFGERGEG